MAENLTGSKHEISSPEELDALYAKLKYRILNQKTNRPFFNTNRDAFEKWHLLSPEQIKKHKIGICWDTASMTDAELTRLGVPHENYFAHAKDAYHKPTHAFNVYKDENGDWRWIEGSWEKYKGNDWKERRKRDLVRRIVKALENEGFDEAAKGDKQILHKIEKFPEAGVDGRQFYDAMLSSPVKKANAAKYSLKEDPTYEDVLKVFGKLDFDDRANLVPRHPDFFRKVPDGMLFDRQVAIDGDGNPVGFNEFYYGRNKLGRRQPPHNAIAVVPEARGNGLARLMAEAAARKARKEKVRRLVWEAFADNDGSIRAAMSAGFEDATPKNAKGYRRFVYRVSEKKASSLDLKKLFPNSKFPTKDELKAKEATFSVGDRVKVSDHIRCRQKGKIGTIVGIDPENKYGWKSFIVKFDDKKYGSMGFSSGDIDKTVEKHAKELRKSAGMVRDEIDYIRKGIMLNPLRKGEAIRGSLAGGVLGGVAGALMGAIPRKDDDPDWKKRRVRRAIAGLIAGAAAGAALTPAVMQYRKYMAGPEYDNGSVDISGMKPGEKVYIGVSGSANGQNYSWFADEMQNRFPGRHYMLRHVDGDKLETLYKSLRDMGADVRVVGHSSGGKTAAKFLAAHPEAGGYLIDPVSWFGRSVPKNAVVFTTDRTTRHGGVAENYIADAGGRWNYEGPNSVVFKGSHSNMINSILRDFVDKDVRPGDRLGNVPRYVSSVFGRPTEGQRTR